MTAPTPADPVTPATDLGAAAPDDRIPLIAYAYEVVATDLLVDTWEETERLVASVAVSTRQVTVAFDDGESEVFSRRPPQQILDIKRLRSLLPDLSAAEAADSTSDATV